MSTTHTAARPATTPSRRRTGRLTLVVGLLAAIAVLGVSCTKNGAAFESASRVNGERHNRGLRELSLDQTLINKAQSWAEHMAAAGAVSHSVLTDGAGSDWRVLGENVGWANSIAEMHALFMASPAHKANIVNSRYTRIGTGVAQVGGRYFVVQVFAG